MGPFFGLQSNDYAGETLLFAISVAVLMLPLAALIVASLFDDLMRRRAGLGHLAPAPLALRRYRRTQPGATSQRSAKMQRVWLGL